MIELDIYEMPPGRFTVANLAIKRPCPRNASNHKSRAKPMTLARSRTAHAGLGTSGLCKRSVGGHEAREHRCHQFLRRNRSLARLRTEDRRIGEEITMEGAGQLDRHSDRSILDQWPQFQSGHQRFPSVTGARIKSRVTTMRSG